MWSLARIPALLFSMIALGFLLSCCRKNVPQVHGDNNGRTTQTATRLTSPGANTVITCGDSVRIGIAPLNAGIHIDSVEVTVGKNTRITGTGTPDNLYWSSEGSRVGQATLRIRIYYNDSLQDSHNVGLVILSDIIPEKYNYRIVRQYPHDDQAFTQGLVYDNGFLYESTGIKSKSSVRITDIPTGKIVKMATLAPQYFGEGIALYKDQIYQVTYTSQVGFVYDKQTLRQIRSFDYQFSEGWGLTTDGRHLIMSDGSAQLFFIEPEFFTQVDKMEVFDNKGLISSLNELEYIRGKILANVYGQSYIVIIDPLTGKVTGTVDLQKLMPEGSRGDYGKVLNGIAFNPQNGHIYVTGKNWPFLYDIELIPSL
jgi:glutamine cyclotransferase